MNYEERSAMKTLRGVMSNRATSAEFNEWSAREVCEYVDKLRAEVAEGREIITQLLECVTIDDGTWFFEEENADLERARAFLDRTGE